MSDTPQTVLIVDDDSDIRDLLRDFLDAAGYRVLDADNGQTGLDYIRAGEIDCVLLDVMMPGMSGWDVLRAIRESSDVPVLFLTARGADSDIIRGLGLGSDDYIVKSATPGEVVARVKTVLRRARPVATITPAVIAFDRLRIDTDAREVRLDGAVIPLTAREYELLELFARHPRQVLTRDQIFERLWGPYGDRHSLTVHIGRLREKLEADPSEPKLITTIWGVGYRFEGTAAS